MTQDEYNFIKEKYGKLIYKISHMITGDSGTCSVDDNKQDLWIAADTAIQGYKKQNDGANGSFEEFKDTSGFDKYVKTVLWNCKNKKGVKATNHNNFFGEVAIDEANKVVDIPDERTTPSSVSSPFSAVSLTEEEQQALSILVAHPSMIKPSGGVDYTKLARELGTYWLKASNLVESIQRKMENTL